MHHRDINRIRWTHIRISLKQGLSQSMCSVMLINIHIAFSWRVPVSRQWINSLSGKSWHALVRDWIDRWLILCFHIDHIWNTKHQLKALSDVTWWGVFSDSVTLCCIWMWTWTVKEKNEWKTCTKNSCSLSVCLWLSLFPCVSLSVSGSALSPSPLPPHTPKTASFEIQNVGEWCWMTRMGYSFCKLWAFMPALPFYPLLLAVLNLPALLIVAVWSRQKKIYPRIEMIH